MPIVLTTGDLFKSGADAFTNPVNCVGTMGAGLAREFKKRYPEMNKLYVERCSKGLTQIGKVWFWQGADHYVINFPTKKHWRDSSQLSWISDGLDDLRNHEKLKLIDSLALPALGCGLGNLSFEDVHALVEKKLGDLSVRVLLFQPQ